MNITSVNFFSFNKIRQSHKINNISIANPVFKGSRFSAQNDEFIRNYDSKVIQNPITGEKAKKYQQDSETIGAGKYICGLDDMDNAIITLGEDLAFCLGDQPLAGFLRSRTPVELIMSNLYENPDIKLPPGPETFLQLSNSNGKIMVKNFLPNKQNVGVTHKVHLDSNESLDDTEIRFLPLDKTRGCLTNIEDMPKNKRIYIGNADELCLSNKAIILPSDERCNNNAFLVHRQKRIEALEDGEKLIIGRKSKNDIKNGRKNKLYTDLCNDEMISREHLIVENLNGKIYITNVGQNKTSIGDATYT